MPASTRVPTSVGRIQADSESLQRRSAHVAVHAVGDLAALTLRLRLSDAAQVGERGLADDAVDVQARVALQIDERGFGHGTEDAVLRPGIEPQFTESSLQGENVVAAHVGQTQVEQTVALRVSRLHQLGPGVLAHHPVGQDQPTLLELARGPLGLGTEVSVGAFATE